MAQSNIEQRLTALEREVAELRAAGTAQPQDWWNHIVPPTPAEAKLMKEAERLGREYRESLRPADAPSMVAKAKREQAKRKRSAKARVHP